MESYGLCMATAPLGPHSDSWYVCGATVAHKGWELGMSECEVRESKDMLERSGTLCVSRCQTTKSFREE